MKFDIFNGPWILSALNACFNTRMLYCQQKHHLNMTVITTRKIVNIEYRDKYFLYLSTFEF